MPRANSLEKTLTLKEIEGRRKRGRQRRDGWMHHCLNVHLFGQALRDGEGQGNLACCSPWGCKESDTPELLLLLSRFSHVRLYAAPSDSPVPGILQARTLEWVAMPSSRGSSQPRDQTQGLNPSLLHWQADYLPLSHHRSPC